MRPIVSLDNVSLRYHSVSGETPAVSHLNLEVLPGEFICIVGPSGCGKSSILSMLAGLLSPSEGSIRMEEHPQQRPFGIGNTKKTDKRKH